MVKSTTKPCWHCDPSTNGCTGLSSDIKTFQGRGIKVLLSLRGGVGSYSLNSANKAMTHKLPMEYLVVGIPVVQDRWAMLYLDGIDFDIEAGGDQHLDEFTRALKGFSQRVSLSAAPQCLIPDAHLDSVIKTGLFDYVWVQFYKQFLMPMVHKIEILRKIGKRR